MTTPSSRAAAAPRRPPSSASSSPSRSRGRSCSSTGGPRPVISAHLAEVAANHPPFDMHLSGTGTFAPVSAVVFVAVARGIGNCELIANDVRRGPLARSLAYPYHPHVTVAHDVAEDTLELAYSGLADLSAEFRVDAFTEFEQTPGGAWAVAREYPLAGSLR